MGNIDKTKLDFVYLRSWCLAVSTGNVTYKIIEDIHPEVGPKLKQLCSIVGTMEDFDEDNLIHTVTHIRDVKNKLYIPDEKTADEYFKTIGEIRDIWDSAMNDPKVQQLSGVKDYLTTYSKILNRFLDGNDVCTELNHTPGAIYLMNYHVDWLKRPSSGWNRDFTLEELNQRIEDLHFGELGDAVTNFMEITSKLRDENLDGAEKQRIVNAIPGILTKMEKVAEYQRDPATAEKVGDLYFDPSMNLYGPRGSMAVTAEAKEWRDALERGWDASYVQDTIAIGLLLNPIKQSDEWFEKVGSPKALAPLKEKFEKIKALDFENKKFANDSEFIECYQNLSEAVKDAIEEAKKPEVVDAFNTITKEYPEDRKWAYAYYDLITEQGISTASAAAEYIIKRGDFKGRGIDESKLNNPRINYNFIGSASSLLSGQFSDMLGLFKPVLGDEFFNDEVAVNYNLLGSVNRHQDALGNDGRVLINPYDYEKPMVFTANTAQHIKDTANDLNDFSQQYKKLLDNPDMQNYKGVCSYISYMQKFVESAREGVDRYGYMSRVPGCNKTNGFADFLRKDKKTGIEFTPQEFDSMLIDMGFDKMWANMDKRCDLEMEMDGRTYGADQNAEYGRRITEINNELIRVYERMMSPEMEQKYSKYYDHFNGNEGTIAGNRGYGEVVSKLKAENEALANGWDASRLADYRVLEKLSEQCKNSLDLFDTIGDPELDNIEKSMRRIASLNPKDHKFSGRADMDTYLTQYSMALKDLSAEIEKPEMQTKIAGYSDQYGLDKGKYALAAVQKKNNLPGVYDIVHEMARKTDISSVLITDFSREREKEVARGKEAAEANRCADTIEDIARQAKEKLNDFTTRLDIQRKSNSDLYKNMRNALQGVSKLSKSNSVEEVNAALENLKKESEIYRKERSSIFKTEKGQSRLDAAADLIDFAKSSKTELSKDVMGTSIEKRQNVKLDEIFDKSLKNAREMVADVDAAMSNESSEAAKMHDGLSRKIEERKNDLSLDEFTNTLSGLIAQKIIDIGIQRKTFTPDNAPNAAAYAAHVSENKHFKNWAKSIFEDFEQRSKLAEMTPGEVYAKYATSRQQDMLKENTQKQMAPAAKPKMEKAAAQKPKEKAPAPKQPQAPGI